MREAARLIKGDRQPGHCSIELIGRWADLTACGLNRVVFAGMCPEPCPIPDISSLLTRAPVIPVLTIDSVDAAVPLARALCDGGLHVIEVTLRTKSALSAIADIAAEVPECIVGAGTVLRHVDAAFAIDAGAKFLVSPGTDAVLAETFTEIEIPVIPGCSTVSEAMVLADLGFTFLKFFPAEACWRHRAG